MGVRIGPKGGNLENNSDSLEETNYFSILLDQINYTNNINRESSNDNDSGG